MNINEMIEQEIQKQVDTRVAAFKAELQAEYDKKLTEAKETYKNLLKAKMQRIFEEEELIAQKCNYADCKNYGDGTVDDICAKCDSYKIKQEKDSKNKQNLADSATVKSAIKQAAEKLANKDIKTQIKAEENNKSKTTEEIKKDLFEETVNAISPFFELFGITKDEIYSAREKMNNPKVKAEAEKLAKELGLELI